MRNKLLPLILLCFVSSVAFSQGVLRGKIIDSTAKSPLGYATVTVFKAADTALITYRLSTPDGEFKVPGLPLDLQCRVVISFSGYAIYRKEFTMTSAQPTHDVGTILMTHDAKSLDEVLVIAERPPVVVKKDTIEFNASAFKTLPNALVEDLLKKLPGVQVDRDGNIAVNGKPVNRILVDGKVFFGDDPKMATRNLPANVIDKVQVMDDKEELLRNGDDNLNNVGKVVNITLKKGVKKGWFGKVYGGAGTDKLFEAGGIANIYRDTLQVSVLGYFNNMNKAGFSYSELMQAGGMERNRSNSSSNSTSTWNNSSGGSGISINGVNFGGAQNYGGIATSRGAGFNLNHAPSTKRSFFAQYFRTNVQIDRWNITDTRQFSNDTIVSNNNRMGGGVVTNGHNMALGARFKPDSVTNILLNASYLIGGSDEQRLSDITSVNNKIGQLSSGDIDQNNLGKTRYYRHSAVITRLSKKKKGRRYTINHNLDINNRFNDNYTNSEINFLYPTPYDSTNGQLRNERIPRTDAILMFNYSDPLSKHFNLRLAGRYEYSHLHNNISTFNSSGQDYDVPNASLTSKFQRTGHRYFIGTGIEYKWKDLSITPSARFLAQSVDNNLVSQQYKIRQRKNSVLPVLQIVYKQLNVSYNKDINLPSFNFLIPVRDNTNPYFITKGNPDLQPTERHNFSVNYYYNNPKRLLNVGGWFNLSLTNNDVVQSIVVDDKGVQTTTPINADGSKGAYMNMNIHKQYKKNPKFIFTWNTGNNLNFNRTKLFYNGKESWQSTFGYSHWVGANLNWNDKVEWNTSYSIYHNFTRYSTTQFKPLEINNHWWDNEVVIRWPKHVIWESQLNYSYNSSITGGAPKGVTRWHAAINFTMLKDEQGVLKLSVFDILNKNNNIWVNASRNMITMSQTNVLGQYFMATFTYNVRAAGVKKKVGGRERLFFF
jgi:hypothetical protein